MTSKHITFILISSLFLLNTSLGQSLKNRAGIELGGGYTYLSSYENSRIIGYSLGIHTDIVRYNKWGLVSGLYFQNKGGENGEKYPDFRAYFKYQYYQVSIPLTTYYNLGRKFTVFMGIYGGRNLPYKLYYHINNTRARFIDDRSEGELYVDKSIRKFEWGSKFGVEFKAFKNISLGFYALHSFQPFHLDDPKYELLVIEDHDYIGLDIDFRRQLDHKLKTAKNAFYCLVVKVDLIKY